MIFTFYKARGLGVGSSLVEDDSLDLAKKLEGMAKEKGVEFILPTDVIVADKFDAAANTQTVPIEAIPDGWMVRAAHAPLLTMTAALPGPMCVLGAKLLVFFAKSKRVASSCCTVLSTRVLGRRL